MLFCFVLIVLYFVISKRLKLDQVPAASLDADDPLNEDDSDDPDSEDDTAQLLAELARIKKERAVDQARKVSSLLFVQACYFNCNLFYS